MKEAQKTVAEIQNEAWLKVEKQKCKQSSLDYVFKMNPVSADAAIKEAKIIYDWLTEDLKQ